MIIIFRDWASKWEGDHEYSLLVSSIWTQAGPLEKTSLISSSGNTCTCRKFHMSQYKTWYQIIPPSVMLQPEPCCEEQKIVVWFCFWCHYDVIPVSGSGPIEFLLPKLFEVIENSHCFKTLQTGTLVGRAVQSLDCFPWNSIAVQRKLMFKRRPQGLWDPLLSKKD